MAFFECGTNNGTKSVTITKGSSNGAYISIVDLYNNQSTKISSNNGTSVTIGGITYTSRGVSSTNPKLSIDKNGTIYTPVTSVTSGQPTKSTYTSGTVLTIGNGDSSYPVMVLFSPS